MKTELVRIEDVNGSSWRLALDDAPEDKPSQPVVVLECLYLRVVDGWVHVKQVTSNPEEVGLTHRDRHVIVLDDKKARGVLVDLMKEHGATARPTTIREGLSMLSTLPGIDRLPEVTAWQPPHPLHERRNLLSVLDQLEAHAAAASTGMWRAAAGDERARAVLDAIVTGAPTDPVCESLSREDLAHVVMNQPLMTAQLAPKLREAFYLLQDLSKAALAARGELDHLGAPQHRTAQYAVRLDMFDRWMEVLGQRCAVFPTIQVPDFGSLPTSPIADRRVVPGLRRPLTREAARALAERHREASPRYDPEPGTALAKWIINAIIEASR